LLETFISVMILPIRGHGDMIGCNF